MQLFGSIMRRSSEEVKKSLFDPREPHLPPKEMKGLFCGQSGSVGSRLIVG